MALKIGDKVVCIKDFEGLKKQVGLNYWVKTSEQLPIKNEVYTFIGYDRPGWIHLKGFDTLASFDESKFRKMDYGFVEEVIKNLKEEPILM